MRILSLAPLEGPGLQVLRDLGEVEIDAWSAHVPVRIHAPDDLIARAADAEVLIVEADFVTREVLQGLNLKALGVCRGETNFIDIAAATAQGIPVVRAPGRNARAVAEMTIGLMLSVVRHIVASDADARAGRFFVEDLLPQQRYIGRELSSLTVGLVGCGAVGEETGRLLRSMGVRVLAFDPFVTPTHLGSLGFEPIEELGDLVAASDVVSLHAPLRPETRGMISADELSRLRPGSYLINTARYGLVDEPALLAALEDGRLAGAGFDHVENEVLPTDHPLATMPNVVVVQHLGGTTVETIERHTQQVADGLRAVLAGRTHPGLVNPEVLGAG